VRYHLSTQDTRARLQDNRIVGERGASYGREPKVPEAHVLRLWLREAVPGACFRTVQGARVRILTVGSGNRQDGPDFLDARIEIDGAVRTGAVEIHVRERDWFLHGHDTDPRYRTVMLHVSLYASAAWEAPRQLPTIILADALARTLRAAWADVLLDARAGAEFPCAAYSGHIPQAMVDTALLLGAAARLERKTRRVEAAMAFWIPQIGVSATRAQTMYEMIARALGFGGNECAFEMLARLLPLQVLAECADGSIPAVTAVLRFAAGRDRRAALPGLRSALRSHGVRVPLLPDTAWRFSRVRPVNSIDRRMEQLAAAVVAMCRAPWWPRLEVALLAWPTSGPAELEAQFAFLLPAPSPGGVGPNRLRELLLNVAAPFFLAEGRRRGRPALVASAASLYHRLSPIPGNRKTAALATYFPLPSQWNGSMQQGLIEVHDALCRAGTCSNCLIGRALFG
jgi:hypothetical protein